MFNIKLSAFLKNIVMTSLTSLITIISMIFVMRFLAKGLGPEEFGAYSLARRIISNIAPLAILSTDIALARYVAMTTKIRQQGTYIFSAIISAGSVLLVLLLIAVSLSKQISYLIFHNNEYLNLYYASFFLLAGYSLFILTYSFFRGRQKFNIANSLQIGSMAILPLAVSYIFASKKDSAFIVLLMGSAFFLSLIPLALIVRNTRWPRLGDIRSSTKTLLAYGVPRAPAGFAFAGLLTLGPLLAGHFGGLKDAGYFVVGQSVFRVMEAAIVGFGLVALPKVSQMIAANNVEFLRSKIGDILSMIFQIGLFVTVHTFIWSREIVLAWLGSEYTDAIPIMKIIILSLGPYLGYVILRSIIDAVEVKAINTLNLFVSLGAATLFSLVFFYTGFGITGLAVGTAIGFMALGILTSRYLIRRYRIGLENFLFLWVFSLNILMAAAVLLLKHFLAPFLSLSHLLISAFILESALFLCYLYFFHRKNLQWITELKKRIFRYEQE